ncbi:hypothetical protein Aduo_006263 [Ancylostoma duodenale]
MRFAGRCGVLTRRTSKFSCFSARLLYVIVYDDVQLVLEILDSLCFHRSLIMHRLAAAHVWPKEKILDMLVEEDHSTAQMLLENLPLYPDLEVSCFFYSQVKGGNSDHFELTSLKDPLRSWVLDAQMENS